MHIAGLAPVLGRILGDMPRLRWPGMAAADAPQAVTAVMVGERCQAVRIEVGTGTRMVLAAAAEGPPDDLPRWRADRLFAGSQAVLVLDSKERHCLTLDRPEVPEHELQLAVRWPLGEALEADPDELLTTALALPRINDTLRPQVLAVAARLAPVKVQLGVLGAAGIAVRSIDIADSALRGMVLTQAADHDGWVVLAPTGDTLSIGLLWRGELCALRTLALPGQALRDDPALQEQLALHVQRTTDLFERQATQLAIRHVLAALPALARRAQDALRSALPLSAQLFSLAQAFDGPSTPHALCAGHNELTALACVAAARLADCQRPASLPAS